jgi:UDP-2,4-diacetamido-2,4,6-trideoxy-beta-L-altropyranose hydrolase
MEKKILFRADGNSEIGLGHLYRLFSLVEMLKDNFKFIFLTSENSALNIIPENYQQKIIPKEITIDKEPDWIYEEFEVHKHILITDGYQFNSGYQKKIKEIGFKLIYIDDLASEHMFADIVINHSPNINIENFSCETATKFALGTQYALLRPTFLELSKKENVLNQIDTAFVCFGGADPYNLTLKVTKALLNINQVKKINIVLGGAYAHKEIYCITQKNIKIFQNLSETELSKVMIDSNFAIAPASTILYELCCVKMPILSGFFVDNQEGIYKGFTKNKAIFEMGNIRDFDVECFEKKLHLFFKSDKLKFIDGQKKIFDKNIKERFKKLISILC